MTHNNKYREKQELNPDIHEMISGHKIAWPKTKEDIWNEISEKIEGRKLSKPSITNIGVRRLAVAAMLLILLGIPAAMVLYTKTINNPAGQHAELVLPDNSRVILNAQSTLSYKPLFWKFNRKLTFEGEAYFEVQQGKKFEVISKNASTSVLGTRFNIFSRDENYMVTCVSGAVKVVNTQNMNEVILHKEERAEIKSGGIIAVESGISTNQSVSWLENRFSFTSVPLTMVFKEIERQYGVKITLTCKVGNNYSGNFMRGNSVEDALKVVCRPFNLHYARKSKNEYIISAHN